ALAVLASAALWSMSAHSAVTFSSSSAVPDQGLAYGFEASDVLPGFVTLTGGRVTTGTSGIAAQPPGSTGNYWSFGVTPPNSSTGSMTFDGAGVSEVSFLWGSPDTYNSLSYSYTNQAGMVFNKSLLGTALNGNRDVVVYLTLLGTEGDRITGLNFMSSSDAFEVDNFRFVSAVPEPKTYALMLAGLMAVVYVSGRRQRSN
ncbi:MAG: sorting protein, partial [Rhizobacter sp.]|nr:sorting protein [Rhizobacter sp.]